MFTMKKSEKERRERGKRMMRVMRRKTKVIWEKKDFIGLYSID
uniref:Catesbeianin-1 antimicrobial peptide n=1 Tax=Aquarana catesbeiana TaxID=8400 RepID=C5IAX4_AQUCT|nr:catesbeianin-1 antimicrobial peptide precursor [Aquarana catesbeiana]